MKKDQKPCKWQHYIQVLHQLQFGINGPLDDPDKSLVYNYKHPDAKGFPTKQAKPKDLFSGYHTYEDTLVEPLNADYAVITEEENYFKPLFSHINGTTDFVPNKKYLAMFIAHCIKRNPNIRKGILKELLDIHNAKIAPYLESDNFEYDCVRLFENRHLLLDKLLKSFDEINNPELSPFVHFLIIVISGLDDIEVNQCRENAYAYFKKSFSTISTIGSINQMLTSIADFLKMGHIKGLLESDLRNSKYVKKLTKFFNIKLVDFATNVEGSGLILQENPVCFIRLVNGEIFTYRYCDCDDLEAVNYIIISLSPSKALLASNKKTDFSLLLEIDSLNILLARNAEINYISKYPDQNKYINYMNTSSFSVEPLFKEEDFKKINNIYDYASLESISALKKDLLGSPSIKDNIAYKNKIYNFYKHAGFFDTTKISPVIAKTIIAENSKNLNVIVKSATNKVISNNIAPSYIYVEKDSIVEFLLEKVSPSSKVTITIFNTGSDAQQGFKYGNRLICTLKLKYFKSNKCFKWQTSGAYIGHHLAIIVVYDESGEIIQSNKILVEVKSMAVS